MSDQLKIVQYNIWNSRHLPAVAAFLRYEAPDIVTLQEVLSTSDPASRAQDAFARLKNHLQMDGCFSPTIAIDTNNGILQGNAILSRLPILEHATTFLSGHFDPSKAPSGDWTREPRNALSVRLHYGVGELAIYTTHLTFSPTFAASERQLLEARALARVVERERAAPLVLAGDFNALPGGAVTRLFDKILRSASEGGEVATFAKEPFKFEGFDVDDLRYKIDHIYVNNLLEVVDINVPDVVGSDHLPIVATLKVRKE